MQDLDDLAEEDALGVRAGPGAVRVGGLRVDGLPADAVLVGQLSLKLLDAYAQFLRAVLLGFFEVVVGSPADVEPAGVLALGRSYLAPVLGADGLEVGGEFGVQVVDLVGLRIGQVACLAEILGQVEQKPAARATGSTAISKPTRAWCTCVAAKPEKSPAFLSAKLPF